MLLAYQNANADNYESIKEGFIVRKTEYDTIISSLKNWKTGDSIQHELILGRRGSGKSTLLKRIEVEITENELLNKKYFAVNLAEEQAGIYRLLDLWEQVVQELYSQSNETFSPKAFSEFSGDVQEYTRYLFSEIHYFCETKKKKAVLLLDNFDRIVGKDNKDNGHLLRETLINYRDLVLIAASTRMDEHFWRYDKPFYEFFRRHRLASLCSEEAFLLLDHWSDSLDFNDKEKEKIKDFLKNNRGKVETIRLLTDGLPRTMFFFLKFVVQTEKPVQIDYLKKIMDEVTPLYQERLGTLTAPMQKIVHEMAFLWEATSTKEIAEKCKMESKLVSANLNTLKDMKIVETITTDKRNNLYRIDERFFNMWMIVTQGNPDQKRKARWMSEFLESWYEKHELQNLVSQFLKKMKSHEISAKEHYLFGIALSRSKHISAQQADEMLGYMKAELKESHQSYMIPLPETTDEIIEKAKFFREQKNYQKAIETVNTIENEEGGLKFNLLGILHKNQGNNELAVKNYLQAIEKGNVSAMFNLGLMYKNQGNNALAEKYYLQAIENGHVSAMFNLGLLYHNQGNNALAEKFYLQAIENGDVKAMFNLGLLYDNQGNNELAEKYYLQAIENGHVKAMFNLGLLYDNQGKKEEAEKYYLQAIENGDVKAMFNLGLLYDNQGNNELAEKFYLQAIENGHVNAMCNLGLLYHNQGNNALAEKYYLQAIENGDVDAMFNLGLLYDNQGNNALAEKFYLQAIENGHVKAMFNLGLLYHNQGNNALAEKYYLQAIENGVVKAIVNLSILYYNQNKNKAWVKQNIAKFTGDEEDRIIIEIWAGLFNDVEARAIAICNEDGADVAKFIVNLLIHHQKSLVDKLFHHPEFGKRLRDQYMILYYVNQILNGKEKVNNLWLRIPPELKSTKDSILQRIKDEQKRYSE